MKPKLSYTIWFSQRTGSTLLCRALASTGIAGNPSEWLSSENLLGEYQCDNYAELQQRLWELGSTSNRVFAVKGGICNPYFRNLLNTLKQFPGCDGKSQNAVEIWENALGARSQHKHIYMTRRNKVRLAVSWWKAIQTQEWHRQYGSSQIVNLENEYSYEAIDHLFAECSIREAAIQDFFNSGSIIPLTIVYENFIFAYEETIRNILNYLELPNTEEVSIAPPPLQKLADDVSQQWVQRYRREKQQGWNNYW